MRMLRRAITTLSFSAISFVLPLRRMPAVSMKTNFVPSRSTVSSMESRVVPATGETMARSSPVERVQQGRFARVGSPDNGHFNARVPRSSGGFFRESRS